MATALDENGRAIEVEGLSVSFHGRRALGDVDLALPSRGLTVVIGPSGSGKTTLMDILGCLSRPTSGQYKFEGRDVGGLDEDTLAEFRGTKIGFVFQSFNLLPRLSALQNVELPLIYGGVSAKQRARMAFEALDAVGLGALAGLKRIGGELLSIDGLDEYGQQILELAGAFEFDEILALTRKLNSQLAEGQDGE